MTITKVILLSTNIPILLVAMYAYYFYAQLDKELRVFSKFLFLSIFIQLISVALYLLGVNNMPLLHVYTMTGGFLIIQFYSTVLQQYISSKGLKIIAGLFVLFTLIDSLFIEDVFTFNTIGLTVEAVIVVILALSTFNILLDENAEFESAQLVRGIHWINSGFFIYFSSNLLLYYFGDALVQPSVSTIFFRDVWMLHSLFSVTMYIFFFIGLWKSLKN